MLVFSFTLYQRLLLLKKSKTGKTLLIISYIPVLLVMSGFFVLFDFFTFRGSSVSFSFLFITNLLLITLLSLFDALFIDWIILVLWKPAFIKKSKDDFPKPEKMYKHIVVQFTLGWVFKIPLALISGFFSWMIL
ncbi:MAG: hypothetical protein JW760_02400 [Spirochaetales bacterium]|nr:hypothetical protein [Spirochaetales bacterium]